MVFEQSARSDYLEHETSSDVLFIGMRVVDGSDAIVGLRAGNFFCYLCAGAPKEFSALVCLEIYLPGDLPFSEKDDRRGIASSVMSWQRAGVTISGLWLTHKRLQKRRVGA